MRHLRRLAETVERNSARPFLIDAQLERELSYGQAHELAVNLAAELRRRGLRRGDRVAFSVPNSVEVALLCLAALYAGLVVVPLGSGFGARELRSILRRSKPELLLTAEEGSGRLGTVAQELELDLLTMSAAGRTSELDPYGLAAADDGWEPFDGMSSSDLVAIHFTSGTTGPPRGVGHRARDFVMNADRFARAVGLDDSHRFYATLPMTYMAGYYNLLLLPFSIGASVLVDRAFDAGSVLNFWEAPIRHSADVIWFVPTMLAMLLKLDRGEQGREYCRDRLRFAASGTAPLAPELKSRFEEEYGVGVHESYGLSETLLVTTSSERSSAPEGTVGTVLPGIAVEIRLGDGSVAEAGRPGAIHVATPDMMVGYLEGSEAGPDFRSPLIDGRWFETGDIGSVDSAGQLRITGRSKEVIIRGGVNVSPTELERVLEGEGAVERVAIVGVPDEVLGEEIAAVVVCRDDQSLEAIEDSLRARARERLEAIQQPSLYLQIDQLPMTPTGKVRRGTLRDLVIDRLGLPPRSKGFTVDTGEDQEAGRPERREGAAADQRERLVDLSHPICEGMTTFPSPNHPLPEITVLARHHIEGRATRRVVLGTHTGTHVDAPLHFLPEGAAVDELSVGAFAGSAQVANLAATEPLGAVGLDALQQATGGRLRHPRLLLRFDWSERWGGLDFYSQSPFLSAEACEWIVDQGVVLLGMDTPSPDDPRLGFGSANDSPNHKTLLSAGVILLEYLTNLRELRSDEVFLMALPLRIVGADGAPARALAFEPAT